MDLATVGTIASAIAAILAWVAKLRWSREYAAAKDEVIRAKDAQIDVLRQQIVALESLTPMKVREYHLSTKAQLEEYIDDLKAKLSTSETRFATVSAALTSPQIAAKTATKEATVLALEAERRALSTYLTHLRNKLVHASGVARSLDDPAFDHAITSMFEALASLGRKSVTIAEDDDGTLDVSWADTSATE